MCIRLAACLLAATGPTAVLPATAKAQAANRERDPARQALAAIQHGQFGRARLAIRRIGDSFQRDALLFALYRRDGNTTPAAEIIGFVEDHPQWPLQGALRQRVEEADLSGIADRRLIAWFAQNPPTTGPGCIHRIGALSRRGNKVAAGREIARCWKSVSMRSDDESRFFRQFRRRIAAGDRAARVQMYLDQGRYRRANRLLQRLKLPARHAAPLRVRIDLQRKPRAGTVRRLRKTIPRLPVKTRAETAFLLDLTRWYRRRGKLAPAAAALAAAPKPVTNAARRWWRERDEVVREFLKERDFSRAYTVAASHRQMPGYRFASAESLAGWIALRIHRRPAAALEHFRRIYAASQHRHVRAMASWWQGEAWRARNRPDEAADRYRAAAPVTFSLYGQLALMRLKAPKLTLPPETPVSAQTRTAFAGEPAVRLARFYASTRAGAESRRLLWWLIYGTVRHSKAGAGSDPRKTGERLLLIAELAHELGERHIAVRAARLALPLGFVRVRLAYPIPSLPKGLPVERALILAIARQESEFNTRARSRANARGLMQLLPATAKFVARRARIKWSPRRLSRDANYNTRLGAAYLDYLLDRFGGSYLLTAAGYNAGPARVARWVERYGHPDRDIDPVDWIESIPFGETRNFVRRVLENVAVYRARLGPGRLAATPAAAWRTPGSKSACSGGACKKSRKDTN